MSYELIRNKEPMMTRRPAITEEEFKKIDEVCHKLVKEENTYRRRRMQWHALIHFMFETGLRRTEICSLRRCDLQNAERTFTVMGAKTHKVRQGFYLTDLSDFLKEFKLKDKVFDISKKELSYIIAKLRELAKLDRPIVAHSFRHGYVTRLLENGCSIQDVAVLAGHCKLDTTLHYFHEVNLKNKYMEHFKSPRVFEVNSKLGIRSKLNIKFQITKLN